MSMLWPWMWVWILINGQQTLLGDPTLAGAAVQYKPCALGTVHHCHLKSVLTAWAECFSLASLVPRPPQESWVTSLFWAHTALQDVNTSSQNVFLQRLSPFAGKVMKQFLLGNVAEAHHSPPAGQVQMLPQCPYVCDGQSPLLQSLLKCQATCSYGLLVVQQ